ncbi:unnamed protein product [Brassica oleracea var. botrytis]
MTQYNQPPVGVPPPQGYPPEGYPPQGYPPQGYPPQGYPQQSYPPPYAPQYPPPQQNQQPHQQSSTTGCLQGWYVKIIFILLIDILYRLFTKIRHTTYSVIPLSFSFHFLYVIK